MCYLLSVVVLLVSTACAFTSSVPSGTASVLDIAADAKPLKEQHLKGVLWVELQSKGEVVHNSPLIRREARSLISVGTSVSPSLLEESSGVFFISDDTLGSFNSIPSILVETEREEGSGKSLDVGKTQACEDKPPSKTRFQKEGSREPAGCADILAQNKPHMCGSIGSYKNAAQVRAACPLACGVCSAGTLLALQPNFQRIDVLQMQKQQNDYLYAFASDGKHKTDPKPPILNPAEKTVLAGFTTTLSPAENVKKDQEVQHLNKEQLEHFNAIEEGKVHLTTGAPTTTKFDAEASVEAGERAKIVASTMKNDERLLEPSVAEKHMAGQVVMTADQAIARQAHPSTGSSSAEFSFSKGSNAKPDDVTENMAAGLVPNTEEKTVARNSGEETGLKEASTPRTNTTEEHKLKEIPAPGIQVAPSGITSSQEEEIARLTAKLVIAELSSTTTTVSATPEPPETTSTVAVTTSSTATITTTSAVELDTASGDPILPAPERAAPLHEQGLICADWTLTGIKWSTGEAAKCAELRPYCMHATMASVIQLRCMRSCGHCDIYQDSAGSPDGRVPIPLDSSAVVTGGGASSGRGIQSGALVQVDMLSEREPIEDYQGKW